MNKLPFPSKLLHPRQLPSWIAIACWWLLVQILPFHWQLGLGKILGDILSGTSISRVRIARRNLELCYPEKSAQEREKILREVMRSTCMGIFESGAAWFLPRFRLQSKYHISGIEHLRALQGKGAIFMGIHFTPIEIGAAFVNLQFPIDGFYRPHTNPVYEYVQALGRIRHHPLSQVIPNDDVRRIVKALRAGEVVNYAPDQDYGRRRSVFAPFFNIATATVKAPAQLAKAGKAEIIPWSTRRIDDFGRYLVTIHAPITSLFSDDESQNAQVINNFIEDQIRACPEQYLWVHRRFKTRPEGEDSLY